MSQNETFAAFQRSLDNRFNDFRSSLQKTMDAFAVGPNIESRKAANEGLYRASKDLNDFLHQNDRPSWLSSILTASSQYRGAQTDEKSKQFINAVAAQFPRIKPIKLIEDQSSSLDFDALYEKHRDSGRLPKLFDELIELANKMIGSGEIESITALDALRKLSETLKANRSGSYLAARQSISIARYLKHLVDVVLEKIPVLAEHREAMDRATNEAESEFEKLEQALRDETMEAIKEQLPRIGRLPNYVEQTVVFINPSALSGPTLPSIVDHSEPESQTDAAERA